MHKQEKYEVQITQLAIFIQFLSYLAFFFSTVQFVCEHEELDNKYYWSRIRHSHYFWVLKNRKLLVSAFRIIYFINDYLCLAFSYYCVLGSYFY